MGKQIGNLPRLPTEGNKMPHERIQFSLPRGTVIGLLGNGRMISCRNLRHAKAQQAGVGHNES